MNKKSLIGERFGRLTVIEYNELISKEKGRKYWKCKCDCGNETNVLATNLKTGHTISCGCFKKSKGERKIELFLKKMSISYKRQYSFDDLTINGTKLRFDFAIFKNNSLMYLIEYQGEQHYDIIEYWGGEKQFYHRQLCDDKKRKYCIEHKIPLIEIHYKDFKNIENILFKMIEF